MWDLRLFRGNSRPSEAVAIQDRLIENARMVEGHKVMLIDSQTADGICENLNKQKGSYLYDCYLPNGNYFGGVVTFYIVSVYDRENPMFSLNEEEIKNCESIKAHIAEIAEAQLEKDSNKSWNVWVEEDKRILSKFGGTFVVHFAENEKDDELA